MIIKNIFPKIIFHPSYWLFALLAIFTGFFQSFFFLTILLFVHECGHFVTANCLHWKTDAIHFYPYGGLSQFEEEINRPLKEEFLVLIMGPVTQCLFYFLTCPILSLKEQAIFSFYHTVLLWFNLLPIYPLDGGKLFEIVFCSFFPYKKSLKYLFWLSYFTLIVLFCIFYNSFTMLVVLGLLFGKVLEERKKRDYYFQRFVLERYLKKTSYQRMKQVSRVEEMYRDCKHLFYQNGKYYTEKEFLRKYYKRY